MSVIGTTATPPTSSIYTVPEKKETNSVIPGDINGSSSAATTPASTVEIGNTPVKKSYNPNEKKGLDNETTLRLKSELAEQSNVVRLMFQKMAESTVKDGQTIDFSVKGIEDFNFDMKTGKIMFNGKEVIPDAASVKQAEELISEDGYFGAKKVTERTIEFAKAISGGDKSKISLLRKAVQQAFDEVEEQFGGLPDLTKQTYKMTMEAFDAWEKEGTTPTPPPATETTK